MKLPLSIFAANASEVALLLVRTIVLARILPPEQFGVAMFLQLLVSVLEMVTDLGLPLSAVRTAEEGKDLRTIHASNVARGLVLCVLNIACVMFYLHHFVADWSVMLVVLPVAASFVRGFEHFGHKRLMQKYTFWREATLTFSAQLVYTSVAIGASLWTRDATGLLWGLFASYVAIVVVSHVVSREPWRFGWSRETGVETLRYGLPLIPNGMASALNFSDRLLVGALLGPAALALYGVAMSAAYIPRTTLLRLSNTLFIPYFINNSRDEKLRAKYHLYLTMFCASSFLYALLLIGCGRPVFAIVFGALYTPSLTLMCLVAMNAFVKFLSLYPNPAAYAFGQTRHVFLGSLSAASAAIPASLSLFWLRDVEAFVAILTGAEALALLWFLNRTCVLHGLSRSVVYFNCLWPLAVLTALTIASRQLSPAPLEWIALASGAGLAALVVHLAVSSWLDVSMMSTWRDLLNIRGSAPVPPGAGNLEPH